MGEGDELLKAGLWVWGDNGEACACHAVGPDGWNVVRLMSQEMVAVPSVVWEVMTRRGGGGEPLCRTRCAVIYRSMLVLGWNVFPYRNVVT
jgi:hypothetical protein